MMDYNSRTMQDITSSYVRGYADRQSHIDVRNDSIIMSASDRKTLDDIAGFLTSENIACTIRSYRSRFILSIHGKENISRWLEKVGTMKSKNMNLINKILSKRKRGERTIMNVRKILSANPGISTSSLSELAGISRSWASKIRNQIKNEE